MKMAEISDRWKESLPNFGQAATAHRHGLLTVNHPQQTAATGILQLADFLGVDDRIAMDPQEGRKRHQFSHLARDRRTISVRPESRETLV